MSFTQYDLIEASDYNGIATSINALWGVNSAGIGGLNKGYGQGNLIGDVPVAGTVTVAEWLALYDRITATASHQGTPLFPMTTPTVTTNIVADQFVIQNVGLITNNSLNSTTQGTSVSTSVTTTDEWNRSLTFTFTADFGSDDYARNFFNAGGQIAFQFSHPVLTSYQINSLINQLCVDLGTAVLSSAVDNQTATISGFVYNGVTKVGGGGNAPSINPAFGFYRLDAGDKTLISQTSSYQYAAYQDTALTISARLVGAVITFTIYIGEAPSVGQPVNPGTVATLIARLPPQESGWASWAAPGVSGSYTFANI